MSKRLDAIYDAFKEFGESIASQSSDELKETLARLQHSGYDELRESAERTRTYLTLLFRHELTPEEFAVATKAEAVLLRMKARKLAADEQTRWEETAIQYAGTAMKVAISVAMTL